MSCPSHPLNPFADAGREIAAMRAKIRDLQLRAEMTTANTQKVIRTSDEALSEARRVLRYAEKVLRSGRFNRPGY